MIAPILCTFQHHDWRIVLLAVLVCVFTTATTLRLLLRAGLVTRDRRAALVMAAGACGGASVWVTHFVFMLAFDPGVPTAHDQAGTLISFVIALVGGMGAAGLMLKVPKPWRDAIWGLAFGLSSAAMHYAGVAALRLPGHLHFQPVLVLASVAFGVSFSAMSRIVAFHSPSRKGMVLATGLLVVAICGLHFIGMIAMTITLDTSALVQSDSIPQSVMAVGVSGLTLLIGMVCLWTMWLEARARQSSMQRIHAMLDALPQAVAYFDEADNFVLGNDAFEKEMAQLGLTPGERIGYRNILRRVKAKDMSRLSPTHDPSWIDEHFEARRWGESVFDQELADDRFLRVETRRTSLGGCITVLSDITDLKKQASDLEAARDAAESAGKAKSQFLANMSHELRTPMNGVIGVADLLAQERLTARQQGMVGLIQSSGRILDRILLDLLDITQIESGVLQIAEAPFDLVTAVDEVVQMFTAEALSKALAIELHPAGLLNTQIIGDVARLKQILANLIANAIKFTEAGRVDVTLAEVDGSVLITVADTGIGFDPALKDRLFGHFEQADGSITRRFGGAGLGLPIARDLAARMGGSLTCHSTPGTGSTFFLSLPLPAAQPAQARQADEAASTTGGVAPNILVVDDVPANRQVLSLILDSAGIRTAMAQNGLDAVAEWRKQRFDAILMDIQMPVMDGLTAVRTIRELERAEGLDPTPIIMVSANAMPEQVEASQEAGANAHLAKPITADRIFAALAQLDNPKPAAAFAA